MDTEYGPLATRGMWGRRARRWALTGLVLAAGAPLGLVVLRSLQRGVAPWRVLMADLRADAPLYLYLTISSALAFSIFGAVLGGLLDTQHRLALTDPLTGLANRRQLALSLEREIALAGRRGSDLAILLVDVDELKRINDRGGHAAGDRALRAVASALGRYCRSSDLAARIGGDEFALLAPCADAREALGLSERIRGSLARLPGSPRISVGVATLRASPDLDAATLLRDADAALYTAKTAGRDRVVLAHPRA